VARRATVVFTHAAPVSCGAGRAFGHRRGRGPCRSCRPPARAGGSGAGD